MLSWLEASALGYVIRNSGVWTYSLLNLTHILGVSTLFGSILMLDLRLLGVWRGVPVGALARPVVPLATGGFVVAALSGVCMLATNGTEYAGNPLLPLKFSAIGAGLLNAAIVNRLPPWKARHAEPSARGRRQLAIAGGVSLICWLTAIAAGRMIGYW